MTSLTEIVAQFEADRDVAKADQKKSLAARLRQIKARLPDDQHTALEAEIGRLDPTE